MNNITSTLSGLTSSLFLNVGLNAIAQKLDPVSGRSTEQCNEAHAPALTYPCSFEPKPRK